MWTIPSEALKGFRGLRMTVERDGHLATLADVIAGWQTDGGFRDAFGAALAAAPYRAFRWETPAATTSSSRQPFECVLLESLELDRPAEPGSFSDQFQENSAEIITFSNLRGDAILIVPVPGDPHDPSCCHLASFLRGAPSSARHGLWQAVGAAMMQRLGEKPVWLSTAGAGVPWLHIRLDDRPKYYSFAPYRR